MPLIVDRSPPKLVPTARLDPAPQHDLHPSAAGANIHRISNLPSSDCGLGDLLRLSIGRKGTPYDIVRLEGDVHIAETRTLAFLQAARIGRRHHVSIR